MYAVSDSSLYKITEMPQKQPFVSVVLFLLHQTVSSAAASVKEISAPVASDITVVLVVLVSVGVLFFVCVAVLFMCTGCYSAEVDTSSHPACRGTKGGGGGYYPTNTEDVNVGVMQSSFHSDEYVSPSSNSAPLPYTMIPTHIPEDTGFSGYQDNSGSGSPAGYTNSNRVGLAGYGTSQATAPVRTGAHINPLEPEEPPPPYGEALHGYR